MAAPKDVISLFYNDITLLNKDQATLDFALAHEILPALDKIGRFP